MTILLVHGILLFNINVQWKADVEYAVFIVPQLVFSSFFMYIHILQ